MKIYILTVNGKANKKDLSLIKDNADLNYAFDNEHKKGWIADIDNRANAELFAMRLRNSGLSKQYFLSITDDDGRSNRENINLF